MTTPTTVPRGLGTAEVERRRMRDGANEIPRPRRIPPWQLLLAQLTHFFAAMLWIAAGLALLAGMPSLAAAVIGIVVLNGIFAFVQEHKADKATAALKSMMPATARVRRDGHTEAVDAVDLVRDDVVLIGAGDRIAADIRLSDAQGLTVDESMLTGESIPSPRAKGSEVFAGTFAVQGDATGVVVAVGTHTRLAGIAALTEGAHRPPSPLAVQLHKLVIIVAVLAVSVGVFLAVTSLLLGLSITSALLLGVGVMVALVPEGLLPTVTLSLARGAQRMAKRDALVRRLDAVETLGATTFICTDKTGTLTRNEMSVVEGWTPAGSFHVSGAGYDPHGEVTASADVRALAIAASTGTLGCTTGRIVCRDGNWVPEGDPMDAALDVLSRRLGMTSHDQTTPSIRLPFSPATRSSAAAVKGVGYVMGAPEGILARCGGPSSEGVEFTRLAEMSRRGLRVLAVARIADAGSLSSESDLAAAVGDRLELLALIGIEDPPREEVAAAIAMCRRAGIRVAMVTGDSAATGAAIAAEVRLLGPRGAVLEGADLPEGDESVAQLLDREDGAVVARVTPADKLRIARALRTRGHVVAMTGDGVNDAAALREADVGVAMGKSGSDVAREAADLVLLDDSFASIPQAILLGLGTFANIRRFLTFHLTDNVAELVPFILWALTGSDIPLAIGVLQVLALDIGTDMLPALALGSEPPNERTMIGPRRTTNVVDGGLLQRALLVLGPTEAALSMAAFLTILNSGGWSYGVTPSGGLLAVASGSAFAVIAVAQMANAFVCRSETRPAWRIDPRRSPFILVAVAVEAVLLLSFLGVPWLSQLLGGSWPSPTGWFFCLLAAVAIPVVDASHKMVSRAAK